MENLNMSTHEVYCSLDICKLLKEAGFDWNINSCYNCYGIPTLSPDMGVYRNYNEDENIISAPTLDVAQRWLREVKECAVIVETHNVQAACVSAYVYCIYPTDATHPCKHINGFAEDHCFNTYEQALEVGIKKALEIILEKKINKL